MRKLILLLCFVALKFGFGQKIHSHNDYVRTQPFWEAYRAGAESIEADVYWHEGQLCVAHEKKEIDKEKTLEKLYLEPLNRIVKSRKRQSLQILIDLKTSAEPTLKAVAEAIAQYPKLANAHKKKKNIKFVISGNRPSIDKYENYPDYIFFDHQSLTDLPQKPHPKIALVSFSFSSISKWKGTETLPEKDKAKLEEIIQKVHSYGYPIRFWATPDRPLAWKTLHEMGVDYINTDQPKVCGEYFQK